MDLVYYFHDGCIKEMHDLSGAYVGEGLSMYPLNDKRILKVIIQRQFDDNVNAASIENYDGTLICAEKLRWRPIEGHMGKDNYFIVNE